MLSLSFADTPQSFVNLQNYIDKLSSLFMEIGRAAPRYQAIALLYPRSKKLQSYLSEYFISVVGLCHYLFKFGHKSTVMQFTSSLSDSHLKNFQTELDRWANSIKEEMYLAEFQESSGSRALIIDFFKSSSRRQDHATRMQVLDFCSKYDHETAWKQTRKAGNSSFYARSMDYQEWRDSSHSRTLMYTGKLGSGKSVMLANIVDDLHLFTKKEQYPVAYFFCKHDVMESLQARTIIGSLVRQLLRTIPDLGALSMYCEDTNANCTTETLLELLFKGFPSHRKVYLVLDGLDECNLEEKKVLIQAVRKIQDRLQVLLCASFREEPNNGLQLITGRLLNARVVSLPDDNPDIEAFIEADLERCLAQRLLTIGDPTLILEIQDALLKGSQGMFLWVALQIQTLCSMKTDRAIREALEDLPKDLSETFARILQKSGSSDPSLQVKTLHLVLAACRPLTTDELREALSVTPGDATWDPANIINDVYSALSCCGCLVIVDEEEFTVRVVHHSFKQYILNGPGNMNHTEFSLREAQRTMADTIVTYLNYGVFGTEISRVKVTPIMVQSAPSKIIQVAMQSSSSTSSLAMKFLKSRKQPAFDMSKVLAATQNIFRSENGYSFRFHNYAEKYWQDHIAYISGHDTAMFRLCSKLFRSQAHKLNDLDRDWCSRFQCAAQNGNKDIVTLLMLRDSDVDLNAKDKKGMTLLHWAVLDGYPSVVQMLIDTGVNVGVQDHSKRTPLITAVSREHGEVVEVLLRSGKADVDAKDEHGRTALVFAATVGYRDMAELLLTIGKANVNMRTQDNETALIHAARRGDMDMVELLLTTGKADVNIQGYGGETALICAARRGDSNIVELLLTIVKADVHGVNDQGKTAFDVAKELGHLSSATLLKEHIDRDADNILGTNLTAVGLI